MWSAVDLTPARLPILKPQETIEFKGENATLYNGEEKLRIVGTVVLTQERLIYITEDNSSHSVQTDLQHIEEVGFVPAKFMRASTKATVQLSDSIQKFVSGWTCEICSFSNVGGTDTCATCGVRATTEVLEANSSSVTSAPAGVCPKCTFHNHASLLYCEMCLTPLKQTHQAILGRSVKFGFADNQGVVLYTKLTQLMKSAGDTKLIKTGEGQQYGIKRLQSTQKQIDSAALSSLETAHRSVDGFRQVYADIVNIATKFDLSPPRPVPLILGPSTDTSESIARQLADLLVGADVLQQFGGMLTLHDLYVVYNRSRGLGLVSPQQLVDAVNVCENLNLPLKLRDLGRVRIVEARGNLDRSLLKLVRYISEESRSKPWRAVSGFSARDISENFGFSVQIATEELELAEQRGQLCRDEHISGLRFFMNMFINDEGLR